MDVSAVLISVDGHAEPLSVDSSAKGISSAIGGGMFEVIGCPSNAGTETSFWFDEEGKFKDLPSNSAATALLRQWLSADDRTMMPGDYLAGPVLVTGGYDDEGDTLGLSADDARTIVEFCVGWSR